LNQVATRSSALPPTIISDACVATADGLLVGEFPLAPTVMADAISVLGLTVAVVVTSGAAVGPPGAAAAATALAPATGASGLLLTLMNLITPTVRATTESLAFTKPSFV